MTALKRNLRPAIVSMIVLTLALGIIYPLLITGIGQLAFPGNSNGQQIHLEGKLIGSKRSGSSSPTSSWARTASRSSTQTAIRSRHPTRATSSHGPRGPSRPYNAAASTFANLGPNDLATKQAIQANIKTYLQLNRPYDPGLTVSKIPVDAVDTSASGLDPDISPANAWIQAHRIAAVRHLPLSTVMSLIHTYTGGRGLGFSGETTVNVLQLNLALDRLSKGRS